MKSKLSAVLAVACLMLGVTHAAAQEKLTVWWVKGFYKSEDDAMLEAIKKFEQKTGVKIELSQYSITDMITKTVSALDSGSPPDLVHSDIFDFQVYGKWALEGRLEDLSSIVAPIKDRFIPTALDAAYVMNGKTHKKGYYGLPIKQHSLHMHYWVDMLEKAGFKESDVPGTWNEFWGFWCDKVQPAYRKATGTRVYSIGMPMGVDASDSFYTFLTYLDAYNVKLIDDDGKLLVDDPKARAGMVAALKDYVSLYQRGCVPPSATSWKDTDNNVAFHNKTIILTPNPSTSIATKWLDDLNNPALTEDQRAQAKKNYYELIRTIRFPKKPDGSTMVHRAAVKFIIVFDQAKNKPRANELATFLLEEENLTPLIEGTLGRWFPVTKAGQERAFWQEDPHKKSVYNQYKSGTVPFEVVKNYKFATLNNENVWAKAMNRVINDKISVEQATDEMIARVKEVAGP
jgi:multiple sugar transport system substrate-binding protein